MSVKMSNSNSNIGKKKPCETAPRQSITRRERNLDPTPTSEDDLLLKDHVTPEEVLRLPKITESKYSMSIPHWLLRILPYVYSSINVNE